MDFPEFLTFSFEHQGVRFNAATASQMRAAGVPDDALFGAYKADLMAQVDNAAERLRNRMLTPGSGQAMEYQEVQAQAVAALKAPSSATPAKYPMLAASIGIDIDPTTNEPANDVVGVARAITAAYDLWQEAGASIRGIRLAGKKAIAEATTVEGANAALEAIEWPALAG
ncbi:hypothetical protein [Methylobacterium iners]|uniref:DUF4376 domain-containing protein n=1 Tax=Methylobacterium iners TaxID=418707 RepID=A0ABQ4RUG5_9HYPH|nr:hypothetical protein [Methylobacterium iners]GJD93344.1 hypothetical protein OCOJLMKI_0537 [Methylobacterium iners]